jgi:ParB family transcriptional regulator, chromosome partitioning protein
MARKTGLGKGLDALIPSGDFEHPKTSQTNRELVGITQIPIDRIQPNPHQPRMHFDALELDELAASIKTHGVLQPLLVTLAEDEAIYVLIAGERRLLAARQAGLTHIPAMVREASELDRVELALIENVQRADLSPLETAEAYRQLNEEFKLGHEEIAARVGKSRVSVTNTLRLLKLPPAIKNSLAEGKISEGHARALLSLPTPQAQSAALQTILKKELNVRQTEEFIRKLSGQKTQPSPKPGQSPEVAALESRLREHLGTKVMLHQKRSGGTMVIHYYSQEELDALIDRILNDR